jgi:hypothetical protein
VSASILRHSGIGIVALAGMIGLASIGCQHSPIDLSKGPISLRTPRPGEHAETFEDSLTGGEVFSMYCNQCHNARALAERPFSNYQSVAAHMRVRACMTGVEYEKVIEFLRRFHDVPSPTPPVETSPKRLIPSQPITELHDELVGQAQPAAPAQPAAAPNAGGPPPQPAPAQGNPQPNAGPAADVLVPAPAPALAQPLGPGA